MSVEGANVLVCLIVPLTFIVGVLVGYGMST